MSFKTQTSSRQSPEADQLTSDHASLPPAGRLSYSLPFFPLLCRSSQLSESAMAPKSTIPDRIVDHRPGATRSDRRLTSHLGAGCTIASLYYPLTVAGRKRGWRGMNSVYTFLQSVFSEYLIKRSFFPLFNSINWTPPWPWALRNYLNIVRKRCTRFVYLHLQLGNNWRHFNDAISNNVILKVTSNGPKQCNERPPKILLLYCSK